MLFPIKLYECNLSAYERIRQDEQDEQDKNEKKHHILFIIPLSLFLGGFTSPKKGGVTIFWGPHLQKKSIRWRKIYRITIPKNPVHPVYPV
jgi:hypothetical protein